MAIENVLERSSSLHLGGWDLPPWIDLILRRVRHALMTDEEKHTLELAEFGAAAFGRPLLEASDLDELDNRLDMLLESSELAAYYVQILSRLPPKKDEPQPTLPVTAQDIASLGIGASESFAAALNLSVRILQIRPQLIQRIEPIQTTQVIHSIRDANLLSLCLDRSVPSEIGLILFKWFCAELCSLAFCEMVMSKRRVEPWLALAIADRWVDGAQKYLRLMASFPGVDVPVEWVPQSERLDLPRIFVEHYDERQRIKRLLEEAEASGLPIYPPGGFDDDDCGGSVG